MKKLTSNKIIAGLLVLMMILSLLPVAAFADGEASNVHVLESSAMEAFAGGTKTEPEVFGEYFTVYWGTKGKVEALDSAKTWEDYSSAQRLSFDGDTKFANFAEDGVSRVIGFTTEGAATVKVWWVGGGSDGRYLAISDANGNIITQTDPAAKGEILCSELSLEAAGTYYLGNSKTCYFFKVEVTEEAASGGDVEVPEETTYEWVKVTDGALTSGEYVLVDENGFAPAQLSGSWVLAANPTVDGDKVTDTAGAEWTLKVEGDTVKLVDANGAEISPKTGNTNGILGAAYNWAYAYADGTFTFGGVGDDTTMLASNEGSDNKYRAYKIDTLTGSYADGYAYKFTLYKKTVVTGSEPEAPAVPAALNGYYNVEHSRFGVIYNLEFIPAAEGAANGTLIVSNTNDPEVDGEYEYAWSAEGGVVVTKNGEATPISIDLDAMTAALNPMNAMTMGNLVAVEKAEENNGLGLGEHHINVTTEVYESFTAPADGDYWFYTLEGENNAYININDWELLLEESGSGKVTLTAGQTIIVYVTTYDWLADTIDFAISNEDPNGSTEGPVKEDVTLVLGENNVTLVPGVQYNVILTGSEEMYATYILSWLSDKVTVTKNDDPLASGTTIEFYNANYTVITLTVSEEVNETLTLAVPGSEADSELVIGDNALNVPAGWDGMDVTFTAPAAGDYVLSPAEGEANHYVSVFTDNGIEAIDLPYTFTLAEGETITFNIGTNNMEADEINLVLAVAEGKTEDTSIQGALDAELNAEVTVEGEIIYIDGKSIYIKDAAGAAIVVRLNGYADDWKVGDYLKATGKRAEFKGLPQISSPTVEHTPVDTPTMQPIAGGAELVKIENLCQTLAITGTLEVIEVYDNDGAYEFPNVTVKDANGNEIVIYKCPNKEIKVGDTVTSINGVLSIYNSNLQILAANASDIVVGTGELNPPDGDSAYMVILAGMTSMVALAAVVVLRKKEIL